MSREKNPLTRQTRRTFNGSRANLNRPIRNTFIVFCRNQSETNLAPGFPRALDPSPLHAQKSSGSRLGMSSTCKPAISTSTKLNQTMPLRFFASSRTLYSLENTSPSKLRPKYFLISYSGKKLQRCHCQKKLPSLLSSQQHFASIFASEPMTLPEIDHVPFFAEHA